ncbi:hypothetical protein N9Z65_00620 [bacterium]|nr:hypothetical protein [bacterium]
MRNKRENELIWEAFEASASGRPAEDFEQTERTDVEFRSKLDELDKNGQLEILSVEQDQVNTEIVEVAFGGLIFDLTFITKTAEQDVPGIVKGNLKSIEFIDEDNVTPEDEAVKKQLGDLIGSHGFPEYTMNG